MQHGNLAYDTHVSPPALDEDHPLGKVVAVSESRLTGVVGESPAVGALVRVRASHARVYGLVASVRAVDPAGGGGAVIEVDLLGETAGGGRFQRGVSAHPPLGAAIFAAGHEEEAFVFSRPDAATIAVGTLHHDPGLTATLAIDDLLGRHFAIFGTTGAGKTCAAAAIVGALAAGRPGARIVVIDPQGEYRDAFGDAAETLDAATLYLPYWLLDFASLAELMTGPEHGAETAILRAAVVHAKRAFAGAEAPHITEDAPIPYRFGDFLEWMDESMGKLDKPDSNAPYLRIKARLEALRGDRRFDCMFAGLRVRDDLPEVLSRLIRIPVGGRPITVLDLSAVPRDIVGPMVAVVARLIYEFALWCQRPESLHVLLLCEGAERFVPRATEDAFTPAARALARIAAHGRRHGLALGLVSARPSALSRDVLAQCNTLIAMRMSDEQDHAFVRNVLPDNARALAEALPTLKVREAVAVGEGVAVPMRLRFAALPPERVPHSATRAFSEAWRLDTAGADLIAETVARWRAQGH